MYNVVCNMCLIFVAKEKSIKKNMTKAIKSKNLQEMRKELKRYKAFDLNPEDKMVVYVQKVVNELAAKESKLSLLKLRSSYTRYR